MTSLCLLMIMIVMGTAEADTTTTTISGGNEDSRDDITVTSVPHDVQCRTSAMSSLLETLGYSPRCIASSLALCSQLKDSHSFGSHIQDMQRVLEELRPSTSQCGGGSDTEEVKTWGPRSCKDLLDTGDTGRGLRQIQPYPGRYTGDAGDSMARHNGQQFSTHDADHDVWVDNCALTFKGGWWYKDCHHCNPNGYPFVGTYVGNTAQGITWSKWRPNSYSLMNTTFMIRPIY